MIKRYLNSLNNIIRAIGKPSKRQHKGIYHIRTWRGGKLYKIIGIQNVLQVKELTVVGKINMTDLYFILHMDNLEILNLKNATYTNAKQNKEKINQLRRNLVSNKKHLKEVWFPASMKSVPNGLFQDCMNLEHVILPPYIKTIGNYAFCNSGIKEITIPSSVISIESHAFDNCPYLEKIKIEDSNKLLTWKGIQFNNCPSLQEIYLGRNSRFEYALTINTSLNQLILGEYITHLNFDIYEIKNIVCLMKKPPHICNHITAENILVQKNFDQFWLHPQWNQKQLIPMHC